MSLRQSDMEAEKRTFKDDSTPQRSFSGSILFGGVYSELIQDAMSAQFQNSSPKVPLPFGPQQAASQVAQLATAHALQPKGAMIRGL